MIKSVKELRTELQNCMTKDAFLLKGKLKAKKPNLEQLLAQVEASKRRVIERRQQVPDIFFPEELPVTARREEIKSLIQGNQVVILSATLHRCFRLTFDLFTSFSVKF